MLARVSLFVLFIATAAQAKLQHKVLTATSEDHFFVTSTLLTGDRDAILIDAQFTYSQAHRVVAEILESGKTLTTVYITHSHPDHYWGLEVIQQAFPKAKLLALPKTIEKMKSSLNEKLAIWGPRLGANGPKHPVMPGELKGNSLDLEGNKIEIVGDLQGDEKDNSYVWVPSLELVVCGDIVYNGVYPWTLETSPAERKDWIATVEKLEKLNPKVVVAGHKNPALPDDVSAFKFMKDYLDYFDKAAASAPNAEAFKVTIKKAYPGLKVPVILELAAGAVFPQPKPSK